MILLTKVVMSAGDRERPFPTNSSLCRLDGNSRRGGADPPIAYAWPILAMSAQSRSWACGFATAHYQPDASM
jgi:hypothetical protein